MILERVSRPLVHALVGLPAAGKSTVARALADTGAVRFSLDEWMLRLHGRRYDSEEYADHLPACRNLILDIAAQVVAVGGDVVLDWNHWSPEKRAASAAWAARCGADYVVHHVDVPLETAQRQLASRNEGGDPHSHPIDVEALKAAPSYFVAPSPQEGHDIRVHTSPGRNGSQ